MENQGNKHAKSMHQYAMVIIFPYLMWGFRRLIKGGCQRTQSMPFLFLHNSSLFCYKTACTKILISRVEIIHIIRGQDKQYNVLIQEHHFLNVCYF